MTPVSSKMRQGFLFIHYSAFPAYRPCSAIATRPRAASASAVAQGDAYGLAL